MQISLRSLRENSIEILLLFFAFVALCVSVWDYNINFPHLEVYEFLGECALHEGLSLRWADLISAINPCLDGGTDRPRFYSWAFWVLNSKFRAWTFQYVPFHPSISLIWIFTFFVTPVMIYKLVRTMVNDTRLALLACTIFILSIDNLSTTTMYFHAAKPLATLGIVIWI